MLITLTSGTTEHYDDEPFAQGGQGALHLSKDRHWVVKLYHDAELTRINALNKIINDYNVTKLDPSAVGLFAWPNAIVSGPRLGVRMPNVNQTMDHKPLTWWIMSRKLKCLPEH